MAVLEQDGTIVFRSAEDFMADYRSHISQGGIYLDTEGSWSLRDSRSFTIQIEGMDASTVVRAEVVFVGPGKVGLQLGSDPRNKEALTGLLERMKALESHPDAATVAAVSASPPEPGALTKPSSAEVPAEITRLSGKITSTQDADELRSARPVALNPAACRSVSPFQLVASVSGARSPLALTVSHKGQSFTFRFNGKGNLVQFLGPESDRDLLERLNQARVISRMQLGEVVKELSGKKFAETVLLEKKMVNLGDLWGIIRDQVVDAFEEIRAAGGAAFQLEAITTGRHTGVSFGSLIVPWMDRALKALDPGQRKLLLDPLWEKYPVVHPNPAWPVKTLPLSAREQQFLKEYLNGHRTLSDAIGIFPVQLREKTLRLVITLEAIGLLEVPERPGGGEAEEHPQTKLAREIALLQKKNKFEQAGVHWSSHASTYRGTLRQLENLYGPDSDLAKSSPEAARLCQTRIELAKQAVEYLENTSRRIEHRNEVIGSYQSKVSAELLFRQALLQLMKQNTRKARELLEMAIELDPQPEYRAKLGSIGT